tara:strand:- start:6611 stop:10495 length:3885 start_codon:yes stop_codon:yes gene_type:complete
MGKYLYCLVFFFCLFFVCFSQEARTIYWSEHNICTETDSLLNRLDFKNSIQDTSISLNNIYVEKIPVCSNNVEIILKNLNYEIVSNSDLNMIEKEELTSEVRFNYYVTTEKKQNYVIFYLVPFRKQSGLVEKVLDFSIQIIESNVNSRRVPSNNMKSSSVLEAGIWYKLGVVKSGLHKIDGNFLNSIGLDINSINPDYLKIFGNKAGMLKEALPVSGSGDIEIDDLSELAIQVVSNDSSFFGQEDYILFFGQSPHTWDYDGNKFSHTKNLYTDTTYYYLSYNTDNKGKRIETLPHSYVLNAENNSPIETYDKYFFYEEDNVNLVNTGRRWFGESFSFDYSQDFETPIGTWSVDSLLITVSLAARSSILTQFDISNGNTNIASINMPTVSPTSSDYYKSILYEDQFLVSNSSDISFSFNNNGNTSALAWLDYFILQGRSNDFNINSSSHFLFRDTKTVGSGVLTDFQFFRINSNLNFTIWDVTDPLNVKKQLLAWDELYGAFKTNTSVLKEFLVFGNSNIAFTPSFYGPVSNQNIHGSSIPDYVIVTHPKFINAATRLANFHKDNNDENVLLLTTEQVYNEFSTGSQDVSAIRNMMKMFYDRSETVDQIPKNLLLFGDASFDYKNQLYESSNYVPTYQSTVSSSIEASYCTDDYFVVLDDGEGGWNGGLNNTISQNSIDIGVGRIPVQNVNDAEAYVDKLINYNSISSRGEWKNKISFVADDADAGWESSLIIHADALAEKVDSLHPHFNINKIYLDSYQQSLSLGSQRYPQAQEDLIKTIQDGVLIVNYVGHGGEVGWASERILELADINSFDNINRLPVFITATCEFTRYDDPTRVSAGEFLLLNNNGGAIALYSTSRTVSESQTYYLVDALYNYLLNQNLGYSLGEVLVECKNDPLSGLNITKRKFSFFGDPHLSLAYPKFNVHTSSIELLDSLGQVHNEDLDLNDTINSLSYVRISGFINDDAGGDLETNNILSNYSGTLFMTVFDKPELYTTLNNDGFLSSPFNYYLQNNIIYNGKVDVIDGEWSFEFIVPKDISYQYGEGKISYYATDSILGEASGLSQDIVIGGISDCASIDLEGPTIQLFMNDTNFVSGGYTNGDPELLALLYDKSGINTIGTGIGHDLTAILDQDSWSQYILNDYYESDLNSFQSGQVIYPFSNLNEGEHTLSFKAWDVYNNSSIMDINFFVTTSSQLAIEHLLNFPNPSSSYTNFVFEHNRPGDILDISVDIFSLNGDLVKSLSRSVVATGFRDNSISWSIDNSISRGIYIYRLSVKSKNDGSTSQKTEKLIILR